MPRPQELVILSKAERMLAQAQTIDEILKVENLAQRAKDYASAAGLGRDTMNAAGKVMLDSRRKAGKTLEAMQKAGELADRGRPRKNSQPGRISIADLGLTWNQSSRYQAEASLDAKVYDEWVERICKSPDGLLTASGLRNRAKQNGDIKPKSRKSTFLSFAKALERLRTSVRVVFDSLSADERRLLPEVLRDLAEEYEGLNGC